MIRFPWLLGNSKFWLLNCFLYLYRNEVHVPPYIHAGFKDCCRGGKGGRGVYGLVYIRPSGVTKTVSKSPSTGPESPSEAPSM